MFYLLSVFVLVCLCFVLAAPNKLRTRPRARPAQTHTARPSTQQTEERKKMNKKEKKKQTKVTQQKAKTPDTNTTFFLSRSLFFFFFLSRSPFDKGRCKRKETHEDEAHNQEHDGASCDRPVRGARELGVRLCRSLHDEGPNVQDDRRSSLRPSHRQLWTHWVHK